MSRITSYLILVFGLAFALNSCTPPIEEPEPTTGTIIGVVTEATTGYSVAQVLVTSTNASWSVTTDVDGYYRIENVVPGDYNLLASRRGFEERTVSISVSAGQQTKADFVLEFLRGVRVTGKVRDQISKEVIDGAVVATDPFVGSDVTMENGQFNLWSITPGTYTLTAAIGEYESQSRQILVENGRDSVVVNFDLRPTFGTIRGTVKRLSDNSPIQGVNVFTDPATSSVLSDTAGNFVIENVSPGDYDLTASNMGLDDRTISITVKAGQITRADFNLDQQMGITLYGNVRDQARGTVLRNVEVVTTPFSGSAVSNTLGNYRIENIIPGTYTVTASLANYTTATRQVVLDNGRDSLLLNFELAPNFGTLRGVVRNSDGRGLSGVNISTEPASSSVVTTSDGSFEITQLQPGNYTVHADRSGYLKDSLNISITQGQSTMANFTLQAVNTVSVLGIVRDKITGEPLLNVEISTNPFIDSKISDASGRFSFDNVPTGTYQFTAALGEYLPVSRQVIVTNTQDDITLNFDLMPTFGAVVGKVGDVQTGQGLAGVNVYTNPATSSVVTDAQGNYTLERLSADTNGTLYTIIFEKEGYLSRQQQVSVTPGRQTTANIFIQPSN